MNNKKIRYILPSITVLLMLSAFPIFKILFDIKNIENIYLNFGCIIYLLFFILIVLAEIFELFILIKYLFKSDEKILTKILWFFLLLIFNIFIIPYFYMKFVSKESKLLFKSILYLVPMLFFIGIFTYGTYTYIDGMNKIKAEQKRIEEERNDYTTKDSITTFTFRHGYKTMNKGEYDLYVMNKDKNVIFSAFTYDTHKYEQKTADDYINKAVSELRESKLSFELVKEKKVIESDDKTITRVIYQGKTEESSMCYYIISVITFPSKPEYLVYTTEIVTKNNYEKLENELDEILISAKIK